MHISVQYPDFEAQNDDERSRVHTTGPHTGTFFNSVYVESRPEKREDGGYDFTAAYMKALEEFLEQEPRAAAGKSFGFKFIH